MRWSVEQDKIIQQHWPTGTRPEVIAEILGNGMTVIAVVDRALRLNLGPVRRRSGFRRPNRSIPLAIAAGTPARSCRYISGDPVKILRAGGTPFCGRPSRPGSSFCDEHHNLCHKPLDETELDKLAEAAIGLKK